MRSNSFARDLDIQMRYNYALSKGGERYLFKTLQILDILLRHLRKQNLILHDESVDYPRDFLQIAQSKAN